MIIIVGQIGIDPRHLNDFQAAVEEVERITRAEEGCISYAIALDDPATGQFSVAERWRDEPALREHLETPHVKKFIDQCGPMIQSMDAQLYDALNARPVA